TIILPMVPYGCETWSLTLREEHRLKAFENRVLRRIFGPKRDEVTGGEKIVISGERGGQGIGPSLPIHLPGNVMSRNADVFLWGYVKSSVFRTPVNGLHDLKTRIRSAISFTMICSKPRVASSICLRATIFQNADGTLWTHCIIPSSDFQELFPLE
ncbi:hypothetical protein B7P43_G09591, partial [Cryptotermes secundus]